MQRLGIGLLVAAIVAPWGAAAQTTTQCRTLPLGGGMTCETDEVFPEAPTPAAAVPINPALVPAKRCNRFERMAAGAAMCDARAAAADRLETAKAIGALAADGKCNEAKQAALRAGDFDLAERIVGLCAR